MLLLLFSSNAYPLHGRVTVGDGVTSGVVIGDGRLGLATLGDASLAAMTRGDGSSDITLANGLIGALTVDDE